MLKDTPAVVFRMACIMSPYRSIMDYDHELLDTAKNKLKVYKNLLNSCAAFKQGLIKTSINSDILQTVSIKSREDIHEALCDDFDTPRVLKILDGLVSSTNAMFSTTSNFQASSDSALGAVASINNTVKWCLNLFGIDFDENTNKEETFDSIMNTLNTFRQNIRNIGLESKNKDILQHCDTVRDDLKKYNIMLTDHKNVSSWNR